MSRTYGWQIDISPQSEDEFIAVCDALADHAPKLQWIGSSDVHGYAVIAFWSNKAKARRLGRWLGAVPKRMID